jgi:hypothetical protein
MRVLLDDKVWQPRHTDRLLDVIRASRSDVAEEVEKRTAEDYAAMQRERYAERREIALKMRDLDYFREEMRGLHDKILGLLEALIDLPMAKAIIRDPETGEVSFDPTLIDDKTAKVALSAIEKALKVSGAMAPPKIEVDLGGGGAFDFLDAVEAEEVEEA